MPVSMTGYGRARHTSEYCDVTVELRAVNHRYYECSVRTPRLLTYLEEPVKAEVAGKAVRGKIDVFVTVEHKAGSNLTVTLNRPILQSYLDAGALISREWNLENDLTVAALARLPDVFSLEKAEVSPEELTALVLSAAREAVGSFADMRAAEGQRLCADIAGKLNAISDLLAAIRARSPQITAQYRARLEARMREILSEAGVDEQRIVLEAALFADKTAIDEEIVRLQSHITALSELLGHSGPVGRKLDFLMQECNREANTIGSKCQDSELAMLVVQLKSELEKIREQVQNLE